MPHCRIRQHSFGSHSLPATSARTLGMGLAPRIGMVASRLGSASGTVSANASAESHADVTQQRGTCRNLELQGERRQRVRAPFIISLSGERGGGRGVSAPQSVRDGIHRGIQQ